MIQRGCQFDEANDATADEADVAGKLVEANMPVKPTKPRPMKLMPRPMKPTKPLWLMKSRPM